MLNYVKKQTKQIILSFLVLSSKCVLIDELISVNNIDLWHLTETWLYKDEYVSLNESTTPSHINTHTPRDIGRGGFQFYPINKP